MPEPTSGAHEKIWNMHAHIFPAKIAEKAVNAIGAFYGIPMQCGGTAEDLIEDGRAAGVTRFLVCSTATVPHQVESINRFVAAQVAQYPCLTAFGSLHPEYPDIAKEMDQILALGLRGIKLHPDFQKFYIDDEAAFPIYEAAEGRLPILLHMGDDRYDFSHPKRLLRVLDRFPKLVVIAAHLGGYRRWQDAAAYYGHPRVYMDTSSSLMFLTPEEAVQTIRRHGVSHVFFGTDAPMWRHADELARFRALPLTDSERKMILWDNAAAFLGVREDQEC